MKLFKAVNSYCKLKIESEVENEVESEVESVRKGFLIVDDSKFSRNILKDILKAEGYLIVGEAGDGLEAIDMAHEKKPEYIFMDVEMPNLDGIGAISKILEFDPEIKIVMCTALGQKKIILEAAKAGAKDYVIKPYKKENIIGVLSVITEKSQKEGQVIPFKSGKKHQDSINNMIIEEELKKPLADADKWNLETDYKIEEEFIIDKNPDNYIQKEEFLQPLENDEDNVVEEGLESLFDCESLQDHIEEEVLESYLNEKLLEQEQPEGDVEPEEVVMYEELPDGDETVTEAGYEEIIEIEYLLEDDETEERAKFVEAILNEEAFLDDEIKGEVESEETKLHEEILEDVMTVAEVESEKVIMYEETIEEDATVAEVEPKEVIMYEETIEEDAIVAEVEPEEVITYEETIEEDAIVAEVDSEEVIMYEETIEEDTIVAEAEPEEAIVYEETSEEDDTVAEVEPEVVNVNEETMEEDTTVMEAELVEATVYKETSEDDVTVAGHEPEKAISKEEAPKDDNYLERIDPDITSVSNSYTYLWNNRFDILQREFNVNNTVSQRVSFNEYAYLETDKYDAFGKDNSKREIALGMMKAYMSLDNRLQQNDSNTLGLRALTYSKEIRLYTSNILQENNDNFTEITIMDAIKYNSLKSKQTAQEITIKTSFYQVICDFVYGKSGRVLR